MTAFFSGTPPTMSGLQLSPVLNLLHARRLTGASFISVEIGASQTDWEPAGLSDALAISTTQDGGPFEIRSMDGGDVKVAKVILNDDDSENLTLKNEYTSGTTAEMRFSLGGSDVVIAPGYGACLVYDTTSSRWNCVAVAIPYPLANDPGTPGADGSLWYAGSGVPSPSPDFGSDGDMYLNTANGDVYQKQSGAWVLLLNISGTDGLPGLNWLGAWAINSPANSYEVNDGVSNGGKSWICIQAHTASSDKEPGVGGSYTSYWDLLADKGADGAGSVNSVFGRSGDVVAVAGDYVASEVTNDSTVSGSTVEGALNSLNSGKADVSDLETAVRDQIDGAASKSTPADADKFGLVDSESSPAGILKYVTWANIKATLKTYLDTLYIAVAAKPTGTIVGTSDAQTLTNKTLDSATVVTTQAQADNSTKIASTAFVQRDKRYSGIAYWDTASVATRTAVEADSGTVTEAYNSTTATLQLPDGFADGWTATYANRNSGDVAINYTGSGGGIMWYKAGGAAFGNRTLAPGGIVTIIKFGGNNYRLAGIGLS